MIAALIRWSVANRFLVLLATLFATAWGIWSLQNTPIDALPDLSDVQVIIRTHYPGQAPQIVENQVTYPLTTTMLSVPGAKTVRGYSFFGDSFVYVLFEDDTDLYWARSRVLEYLSQIQSRLPASAKPSLGPDATGGGWIYQYALVDRTGRHDLAQLRALQDWFLKFELKTLANVAEVATIGGMVKQYQVQLDPIKLASLGITQAEVTAAIGRANQETGGAVLELAETEFMVRASGYLQSLNDFRAIPLRLDAGGVPVTLGEVAHIQLGPEMRRGIAELDGEGEVVGGVVILRSGKNARSTIDAVKAKLETLQGSLPDGVEIVTTYDRSQLIDRAVRNLGEKLVEEFIVVALVCAAFLWHLRSSLVAIVSLPVGVLIAFAVMQQQGINANIMSLGGIAIAIGAMVDAAVVMIENAHKKIEAWREAHPGEELKGETHWRVITDAAVEVGPALFFCLLIITLSFIPVFTLQAQEGRLFGPLAFTKTYAMAAAAAGRRVPAAAGRGRSALYAFGSARLVGAEGRAVAAADRPDDQERAGSRPCVRQGRPRRNRHRPGTAGDVRDHYPVQAARAVARRHDRGQAGGGAGPGGAGTGADQYLDSADPQPYRHARHRDQEPDRGQGRRCRPGADRCDHPGDREGCQRSARGEFGAARAADRRALYRCRYRPGGGGALRPEYRRCAGDRLQRHRR